VECLPLLVIDFELGGLGEASQALRVILNTGREYTVSGEHPLYLPQLDSVEAIPAVKLDYGLAALFSRAAWYRLAELCEEKAGVPGIFSAGRFFALA
jgi:hypothetical protein